MLYGFLLRLWWRDTAEKSADRLTLLLVKNPKLLTGALLKFYAVTDPLLQDRKLTATDVDNYIRQSGAIGTAGLEISTQYKMGQAIHDYPVLEDRLQSLTRWAVSPEFKTAVDTLAETRSPGASAANSTAPGTAPTRPGS
jgi:Zn-dependent protease with chaperone function